MSEQRRRTGFPTLFSIILTCFVLGGLCFSIFLNVVLAVTTAVSVAGAQAEQTGDFSIKTVQGQGPRKILVIPVEGIIVGSHSPMGWGAQAAIPEQIDKRLEKAADDKDIEAVILKISSPGGTISATDQMYEAITRYKNKTKRPVVAYMEEVAASGGYYIAAACDKIIAQPTAITGSIGVIMSYYQVQELLENKLGIQPVTLKSGKHKDIGSTTRTLTDSEREILRGILDEMYQRFLDKVKQGRPQLRELAREEFAPLVDGRVFTGSQAKDNGLVDSCGLFRDAIEEAATLAGISAEKTRVIEYQKPRSVLQELLQPPTVSSPQHQAIDNILSHMTSPRFYYLWKP